MTAGLPFYLRLPGISGAAKIQCLSTTLRGFITPKYSEGSLSTLFCAYCHCGRVTHLASGEIKQSCVSIAHGLRERYLCTAITPRALMARYAPSGASTYCLSQYSSIFVIIILDGMDLSYLAPFLYAWCAVMPYHS